MLLFVRLNSQDTGIPHGDNFSRSCEQCHSTESWQVIPEQVTFDHNEVGFPLEGAHQVVTCRNCHQSLIFNRIGSACADCHTDIHEAELGFRCENCHTPESWILTENQRLRHMETDFPLTGIHAVLDCESCHRDPLEREFANTPVECQGCHLLEYTQTTNPSHSEVGFGTNCRDCHRQNSITWDRTSFIHTASFPLEGGHGLIACTACHESQYEKLPTDCYYCHQTDYESTTEPDHLMVGFPNSCEDCHTISGWKPANWNHDTQYFPIYSGRHRGEWNTCEDCHVNPSSYQQFECIECHAHTRAEADDEHDEVNDYVYASSACYSCHPRGRGEDD